MEEVQRYHRPHVKVPFYLPMMRSHGSRPGLAEQVLRVPRPLPKNALPLFATGVLIDCGPEPQDPGVRGNSDKSDWACRSLGSSVK